MSKLIQLLCDHNNKSSGPLDNSSYSTDAGAVVVAVEVCQNCQKVFLKAYPKE